MLLSSKLSRIISRLLLVVAVLVGQFTGGGGCCCWIRSCVAILAQAGQPASTGQPARAKETKLACPKCRAKFAPSQGIRERIQDSSCHCVNNEVLALSHESDVDVRLLLQDGYLVPSAVFFTAGRPVHPDRPLMDEIRLMDRLSWHARACIWRI